jgi:hypothetical protein
VFEPNKNWGEIMGRVWKCGYTMLYHVMIYFGRENYDSIIQWIWGYISDKPKWVKVCQSHSKSWALEDHWKMWWFLGNSRMKAGWNLWEMMESGIVVKVRRDFLGNQVVNLKSSVVSQTDTFHSTEMHGKFDKVGWR